MVFIFGDTSAINALIHALGIIILISLDQIGSKIYNLAKMYNDNQICASYDYMVMDFEKKYTLP